MEGLSPKRLKKKYLCSDHFERNDYVNPNDLKSRINTYAVPKKCISGKYLITFCNNIFISKTKIKLFTTNRMYIVHGSR